MAAKIEMSGKRFGRLTVISQRGSKNSAVCWDCICDCGAIVNVRGSDLRREYTKSCGCMNVELTKERNRSSKKIHGHSAEGKQSRTYASWHAMKLRCQNKNHDSYKNYGGRGIEVCERWEDFKNFLSDMGERPEGKTLDRIDGNDNYRPDNCRWATPLEQSRNRRAK